MREIKVGTPQVVFIMFLVVETISISYNISTSCGRCSDFTMGRACNHLMGGPFQNHQVAVDAHFRHGCQVGNWIFPRHVQVVCPDSSCSNDCGINFQQKDRAWEKACRGTSMTNQLFNTLNIFYRSTGSNSVYQWCQCHSPSTITTTIQPTITPTVMNIHQPTPKPSTPTVLTPQPSTTKIPTPKPSTPTVLTPEPSTTKIITPQASITSNQVKNISSQLPNEVSKTNILTEANKTNSTDKTSQPQQIVEVVSILPVTIRVEPSTVSQNSLKSSKNPQPTLTENPGGSIPLDPIPNNPSQTSTPTIRNRNIHNLVITCGPCPPNSTYQGSSVCFIFNGEGLRYKYLPTSASSCSATPIRYFFRPGLSCTNGCLISLQTPSSSTKQTCSYSDTGNKTSDQLMLLYEKLFDDAAIRKTYTLCGLDWSMNPSKELKAEADRTSDKGIMSLLMIKSERRGGRLLQGQNSIKTDQ